MCEEADNWFDQREALPQIDYLSVYCKLVADRWDKRADPLVQARFMGEGSSPIFFNCGKVPGQWPRLELADFSRAMSQEGYMPTLGELQYKAGVPNHRFPDLLD